jgi:hypothetical protein
MSDRDRTPAPGSAGDPDRRGWSTGEPDDPPVWSRTTAWVLGLVALVVVGLAGLALAGGDGGSDPAATPTAADAARARRTTPPRSADPNDAWFVPTERGMQLKTSEVIDDPGRDALFLDRAEARVYRRHGVDLVRMRSYSAGAVAGATLKVVSTQDPVAVLRDLDRTGPGLGRSYPALPHGHVLSEVVQVESTAAHDVFMHFYTITFTYGPYVVSATAFGTSDSVSRRRAERYAEAEHDLLTHRGDPSEGR